jgi:hypothetical protein
MVEAACLFCGSSEDLTEEDVIAKWILRLHPPIDVNKLRYVFEADGREPERATGRRPKRGLVVTNVCHDCNTRWMSGLEREVIPYLRPLLLGESVELGRIARQVLAKWCLKTALVREYQKPAYIAAPQSVRDWFRRERQAPDEGFLVAARPCLHHDQLIDSSHSQIEAIDRTTGESVPSVLLVTLGIRRLALRIVMDFERNPAMRVLTTFPDEVVVWPITTPGLAWPGGVPIESQHEFRGYHARPWDILPSLGWRDLDR